MAHASTLSSDDSPGFGAVYAAMTESIGRWTEGTEDLQTAIPSLGLFRRESPTAPCQCRVEPSIVLVTSGAKQLLVGGRGYLYDTGRFLITSIDMPADSQVLDASRDAPCVGLVLKLDLSVIAELISQNRLLPPRERASEESAYIGHFTPALLEPFSRLLGLLDAPEDIDVLAPMIQREIHYRLLKSDLAAHLWRIVSAGSQSQRIGRAIDWLKLNFDQPLRIDDLAAHVQMSSSSLHHYFRQLTAKSPLQYQKWLRLGEARRLMLNEGLDAAHAAFQVGYESPSQFSRDYSRMFGAPPKRDIDAIRAKHDEPRAY